MAVSRPGTIPARLRPGGSLKRSAGHPAPLIVAADGRLREFAATGPILGAWSDRTWNEHTLELGTRETILAYTDGVTDARGRRERYGVERLRRLLASHASAPPGELVDAVDAALDGFAERARGDDTALLALRRAGPAAGTAADA